MKRLVLTTILGLVAMGCVESDQSIAFIAHAPLEGKLDDESGLIIDCATPSLGDGLILFSRLSIDLQDVQTANSSFNLLGFMVSQLEDSDQLAPIGADYNLRTNQNAIQLERAVLTFPGDNNQSGFSNLDEEYDFTAYIGSGEGQFYGNIPLIRPTNFARWEQAVNGATGGSETAIVPGMVEILIEGSTTAGNGVESSLLKMPFDVCNGCGQGTTPTCVVTD